MTWLEIILLAITAAITFPVWFPMLAIMGAFAFTFAMWVGVTITLAACGLVAMVLLPCSAIADGVRYVRKRMSKGQSDA